MRLLIVLALAGGAYACSASPPQSKPPIGQIVLYVDTDAPVPSGQPGSPGLMDPTPLFDRLRIDGVAEDGTPCDCTREIDVTADMFQQNLVSFGIVPPPAGGAYVRLRLFRSAGTLNGEPTPDSTIDVTYALPSIASEGLVERTAVLPTDNVGSPIGQDQPIDTFPGKQASHVGSWAGAQRVDCPAAPGPGEVCIPGGAYWMGNPLTAHSGTGSGNSQRLVVVSPFYLDATEVTVAEYRASGLVPTFGWSGQNTGQSGDYCTYTQAAGPYDTYPINCIAWFEARAYCQKAGKDLPTEAQFEYAASGLASKTFVWGNDLPACEDAVLARAGAGTYTYLFGECRTTKWGGAMPPGSGLRDQLVLPTGTVVDLAGNVGEQMLDRWNLLSDPCWATPGVYRDPMCGPISACNATDHEVAFRGGDWSFPPVYAMAAHRTPTDCRAAGPMLGFRCARPAQ